MVLSAIVSGCSDGAGSGASSTGAYLNDLATILSRQLSQGYPRLAIDTQVSYGGNAANGYLGQNLFSRLHWYDYVLIDGNNSAPTSYSSLSSYLGFKGSIRALNPNSIQTAYFSIGDFINYAPAICYQPLLTYYAFGRGFNLSTCADLGTNDLNTAAWFFHDTAGSLLSLYPFSYSGTTYYSHIPNPSNALWQQRYIDAVQTMIIANQNFDGVYHDWGAFPTLPYQAGAWAFTSVSLNNNGVADMSAPSQLNVAANPVNQAWQTGLASTFQQERVVYPSGFIVTANSGWGGSTLPSSYTSLLQGSQSEDFLTAVNAYNGQANSGGIGWSAAMYTYGTMATSGRQPNFSFIHAALIFGGASFNANNLLFDLMQSSGNNWITSAQMVGLRFALASSLMFNGYFASSNTNASGGYSGEFWLDEFAVNSLNQSVIPTDAAATSMRAAKGWLGQPLAPAYNVAATAQTLISVLSVGPANSSAASVWRRDYTNGIVLVNPTGASVSNISLGATYRKINGAIDPAFNNGASISTITLPSQTGVVLHN